MILGIRKSLFVWLQLLPEKELWESEDVKTSPQQDDEFSCGVFVCVNTDRLSQNLELNYSPLVVLLFREQIALSLLNEYHPF